LSSWAKPKDLLPTGWDPSTAVGMTG